MILIGTTDSMRKLALSNDQNVDDRFQHHVA